MSNEANALLRDAVAAQQLDLFRNNQGSLVAIEYGPTLPISKEVHATKYRGDGENFYDAMTRIADALKDDEASFYEFRRILLGMFFMPAGRVQSAMGSAREVTPYNCFVSGTIEDSMDDIMAKVSEAATTLRKGGGIGYDFSGLRPRNDLIKSLQSRSSGPISFMGIFNAVCQTIAAAGHRRGAQMGVMRVDHPDIEEFVHAKNNSDQLTSFNMSIAVTDEFMVAVETDGDFDLRFNGRVYRTIKARRLWDQIMRSTWDWAEPGVLFIDRINDQNNLSYCEDIAATNPCVTGDTPILTSKGYRPIEECVGETVEIWNGEDWSEVTPFSTGVNPLVSVELSNGVVLKTTPYHEFILIGGVRKMASDLEDGDRLERFDMPVIEAGSDPDIDAYSQGFYSGDGSTGKDRSWVYEPKYPCISRLKGNVGKEHEVRKFKQWYHGWTLDKNFVPVNGSAQFCVDWLAGMLDSDGAVVRNPNSDSLQISSIDREFLLSIQLMLTRLGVKAHVSLMRAAGFEKSLGYDVKDSWRLCINCADTQRLVDLGLRTERLRIRTGAVQRDARRFVLVTSVTPMAETRETFCFTEPKVNRGTFNGIVTGQCAEQPLPPYGACLLGSSNLTRYVQAVAGKRSFDWDAFIADIPVIVRAMDNIVDRAIYPLEKQRNEAKNKRRMGLGVTGLRNTGEALGFPYGSPGFLAFEDRVLSILKNEAYRASAMLAREKGAFPLFVKKKYMESKFIKTLDADVQKLIAKHGVRNSHLTSIAPTGTISLAADNVSSGIEPVFAYSFDRTINMPDGTRKETVEDYGLRVFGVKGKIAKECSADDHLNVLLTAYKHVDSAVSKTCNVSPDMPWDDFKNLYYRAWKGGCKGATTFNEGGKRFGILNAAPSSEENQGAACYIDAKTGKKTCD